MHALLSGRSGRIVAHAAVLTAVIGSSVAYAAVNKTLTLDIDGRTTRVHALHGTVGGLLKDQGLRITPRDIVAPASDTSLHDGETIVVRFARPLTLTVDGQRRTYWTTELSVDRALAAIGVRTDGALLSASRSQPIGRKGLAMWLSTPKHVTLDVGGVTRRLVSAAPTVGELLTTQGVQVRPLDKLSAVPSRPLTDGLVIRLVRVDRKRVTVSEKVPFDITRKKNADLYVGQTKVITPGHAGSRSATYDLVLTNGRVSSRALVSADVLTQPVAQVEQVGTKPKPSTGGSGGSGGSVGGDVASLNWAALAKCESGGNPKAVNSAGYYGLYQFSLGTWHAMGGSGNPIDNSAGEQTYRAQLLYKKSGASSWPSCGRKLYT